MKHKKKKLSYGRHHIDEQDISEVVNVLKSDWLTTGEVVNKFEKAFAKRVGAKYAVSCSSGTAALHLASLALNLTSNDNVIIPSITFAATANSVRYCGANIIFSDVDKSTGLINEESIATLIDGSTKAIYPVHLNGQPANMPEIHKIAIANDLKVIEDASHALGTEYKLKNDNTCKIGSCTHSDMTTFSFHPVKTITMGEGGVVTTNSEDYYSKLISLRNHGILKFNNNNKSSLGHDEEIIERPWFYEIKDLGFNYRTSDINCALGLSQLKKLDKFIKKRGELVQRYDSMLKSSYPKIIPIDKISNSLLSWHLYVIFIDYDELGITRENVIDKLLRKGISTQVHYIPLYHFHYYKNW